MVVGAVGDGAHGRVGQAVIGADLGHGGAFHLDGQGRMTVLLQPLAQGLHLGGAADKTVAAGDQALVQTRRSKLARQTVLHRLPQGLAQAGMTSEAPASQVVMNAAPLQHHARWDIHSEGTQPAVRAVTDRLDAERVAIREALGYAAPHYPLADHYNSDRWMYGDAHRKLQKSGDWREHIDLMQHRYVTEDIELGLSLLASVARWAGVDAPVSHGLLALAGAWLGRDLRRGPRSFEAIGLSECSRESLAEQLENGFRG